MLNILDFRDWLRYMIFLSNWNLAAAGVLSLVVMRLPWTFCGLFFDRGTFLVEMEEHHL